MTKPKDDDDLQLPKWFRLAGLFAKSIGTGTLFAIGFINLPWIKEFLNKDVEISGHAAVNPYQAIMFFLISLVIPCIIIGVINFTTVSKKE